MTEMHSAADTLLTGDMERLLGDEHAAINARRTFHGRKPIDPSFSHRATHTYDLRGVCLSGGGVRSATFCLGAMQALEQAVGFKCIDLLSTVSGGGYLGSSITAAMAVKPGFPYATPGDRSDMRPVGHLRDFSNYLIPRGENLAVPRGLAVVLRGLALNGVLTAAWMAMFAAVTALGLFGRSVAPPSCRGHSGWLALLPARCTASPDVPLGFLFGVPFLPTLLLLAVMLAFLIIWALRQSRTRMASDIRGSWPSLGAIGLLTIAVVAWFDLEPLLINGMVRLTEAGHSHRGWFLNLLGSNWFTGALAGLGSIIAFFADQLGGFIERNSHKRKGSTTAARLLASGAMVFAALIVPLMLWLGYLEVSIHTLERMGNSAQPWLIPLIELSISAAVLVTAIWSLAPNANSLHRLYRDRLSEAFLFDPTPPAEVGQKFKALDRFLLSEGGTPDGGPYHLINAALNIEGSRQANRLGRNADFFLFSPLYVGSDSTCYRPTTRMEEADPALNLGTAMAISGAAASADMGAKTNRLLAPTLALLNVRLGYWLRNPKYLDKPVPMLRALTSNALYLVDEMFGRLDEKNPLIYLTDGGHIENLGLYQLLRRRCRVIFVVDAEADPDFGFGSLVTLERYARIDLGIRLKLPWQAIGAGSKAVDAAVSAGTLPDPNAGPHAALGVIEYAEGVLGTLLYLKASLSGDENDYIMDYKRRYRSFPHESTGDQFFTEEQFEAYRALGYHAMSGTLPGGTDRIAFDPADWPAHLQGLPPDEILRRALH